MINHLKIENFKSIRSLDLPLKRVNILIGDTSSGKSNIIEAMSLLSMNIMGEFENREIIRFNTVQDLFFDLNVIPNIRVKAGVYDATMRYFDILDNKPFEAYIFDIIKSTGNPILNQKDIDSVESVQFKIEQTGKVATLSLNSERITTIFRTYIYKRLKKFNSNMPKMLHPPHGINLPQLLIGNRDLRQFVSDVLKQKGYRLSLKTLTQEIEYVKDIDDTLYPFPYITLSDTLSRYFFIMSALKTNSDAFLIFDEPDVNAFPPYVKHFAERIALDENKNQFLITTHNPYLLGSLLAKTKTEDINLCVTRLENYETKVYPIPAEDLEKVVDYGSDIFFNLDRLID